MKKKCNNCGGVMTYDVTSGTLVCDYCGVHEKITAISTDMVHGLEDTTELQDKKVGYCEKCGLSLLAIGIKIDSQCPYCNGYVKETTKKIEKIDGIIPFKVSQDKAQELFIHKLKNRAYAPAPLKKMRIDSSMNVAYISAYKFKATSHNEYKVRVSHQDSEGHTRYVYHDGSFVSNHVDFVEASKKIAYQDDLLESFENSKVEHFDEQYLSGYPAELPNMEIKQAYNQEVKNIDFQVKATIRRKYGGACEILKLSSKITDVTYARVLLPIYSVSYQYKKKQYINFVNGETGELFGRKPKSVWKILFTIFGIVGIIAIIVLLTMGA